MIRYDSHSSISPLLILVLTFRRYIIQIDSSVRAVLASQSSAQKSEVKAWEEEIIDCAHTRECAQLESTAVVGSELPLRSSRSCGLI